MINIVIADDQSLIRYSLRSIITTQQHMQVLFEASNGLELIDHLKNTSHIPDVLLLDIGMPLMNGYEAITIIKKNWPAVKIIIYSQHCGDYSINYMLYSGANAFLSKQDDQYELLEAIQSVYENDCYYSSIAPKKTFDKVKRETNLPHLSPQQKTLLHLLAEGHTNKEIAQKMELGVTSVESYRKEMCRKFDVKNRTELIRFAIQNEMVYF